MGDGTLHAVWLVVLCLLWGMDAAALPHQVQTVVYKTVVDGHGQEHPLKADLHFSCPAPGPCTARKPVLLYFSGGGFITTGRAVLEAWELDRLLEGGFHVVSVDTRRAPQDHLEDILSDMRDALAWVHGDAARTYSWDAGRVGVVGHSCGAFLALMAGLETAHRPAAVVALDGYGDFDPSWVASVLPFGVRLPEASTVVLRRAVLDAEGSVWEPKLRQAYYLGSRLSGTWAQETAGAGRREAPSVLAGVDANYPPTLLVHGAWDVDVPVSQAWRMRDALAAAGVVHQLVVVPRVGHAFVSVAPSNPDVVEAVATAVEFLKQHVGR